MAADPRNRPRPVESAALAVGSDIHPRARTSSGESEILRAPEHLLITVPEAASLLRVGKRTVWRLMADPESGFPSPRRIRGRTLLVRDEVLAFVGAEASQ
ncbi:MAG: helix-turn-helix domain-containing protein [Planctomycetes bacterium]|nr:helix-turn-helix domain-containing protein [Planctomycetota bacterium]